MKSNCINHLYYQNSLEERGADGIASFSCSPTNAKFVDFACYQFSNLSVVDLLAATFPTILLVSRYSRDWKLQAHLAHFKWLRADRTKSACRLWFPNDSKDKNKIFSIFAIWKSSFSPTIRLYKIFNTYITFFSSSSYYIWEQFSSHNKIWIKKNKKNCCSSWQKMRTRFPILRVITFEIHSKDW